MSDSQIIRLALHKRRCTKVRKHTAKNDAHLRQLIDRLDAAGDAEAADTIAWLVWWNELALTRMYEAWAETAKAEGLMPDDATERGKLEAEKS